jgi:hypothetical protein
LFFVFGYRSFIFFEAFNDLLVSHAANHDTLNGSHKYESLPFGYLLSPLALILASHAMAKSAASARSVLSGKSFLASLATVTGSASGSLIGPLGSVPGCLASC